MKRRFTAFLTVACSLISIGSFGFADTLFTAKLISAEGEALIGVNVLIPGTSQGTVTDVDGFFQLEVPEGTTELYISYSCFGQLEVGNRKSEIRNRKWEGGDMKWEARSAK